VTETSTFIYKDLNPTKIEVFSKVNNHSVGFGKDFKTDYFIEYAQDNTELSKENFRILNMLSQSMLYPKGLDFVIQSYIGILPTKLIKSITRKPEGESSEKTIYNFKKDKENKIVEIKEVIELPRNENITTLYKIKYDCK
jgi:hypothetical protein